MKKAETTIDGEHQFVPNRIGTIARALRAHDVSVGTDPNGNLIYELVFGLGNNPDSSLSSLLLINSKSEHDPMHVRYISDDAMITIHDVSVVVDEEEKIHFNNRSSGRQIEVDQNGKVTYQEGNV